MAARNRWLRAASAVAAGLGLTTGGFATAAQPARQGAAAQQRAAQQQRVRWEVNWGPTYCTLARGSMGNEPVAFGMRIVPGGETLDIIMVSGAWADFPVGNRSASATVRLLPSGRTFESEDTGVATRANGDRAIILRGLPRELIGAFGETQRLRIERRGRVTLDVPVPSGRTGEAALRQCIDDVLRQWGVDPAAQAALRRTPQRSRNQSWFRTGDYPAAALESGSSGAVVTRIRVDETGRVTDCLVVGTSGDPALDAATCRINLLRGQYREPALGPDGRPVAAIVIFVVRWRADGF